jgi:hypothetical protein
MNEFINVLSGLLLGSILGAFRSRVSMRRAFLLAGLLGTLASLASGELRISWSYLLVDTLLVSISMVVALAFSRQLYAKLLKS